MAKQVGDQDKKSSLMQGPQGEFPSSTKNETA